MAAISTFTVNFGNRVFRVGMGASGAATAAALRAEAAAVDAQNIADAMDAQLSSIVGTGQIGLSTAPVTGTNVSAGAVLMLENPLGSYARSVTSIKAYCKAVCTITVARYLKSGTTVTLVSSVSFSSGAIGAKTWTSADFGALTVSPGEFLTISPSVAGGITFNSGTVAGGGYYTITGTTASSLVTANHLEVQVNYATQQVVGSDIVTLRTRQAAHAAAGAILPVYSTTGRVGIAADPVDGTAFLSSTFLLETPVAASGYLASLKLFAKTTGTITLGRYTKSGSNVTLVQSYSIPVSQVGLVTLTPDDFGTSIPLTLGEYLGITANGIATYNTGVVSGGGYYTVSGSTVGGLTTATHLEVQANTVSASVSTTDVPALKTLTNALAPARGLIGTGRVGIAADPVTGTGMTSGTIFISENPVGANALYLTSIKVFALTAGSFTLYRYKIGGGSAASSIASYTINVAAGLNSLTRSDFGDIPVNAGEWLAIDGQGRITFNSGTVSGGGYRQVSGGGAVVNALTTTHHLELRIDYATSAAAAPAPRNSPASSPAPLCTDGRTLIAWHAKLAKYKRTGAGKLRIALLGDSWHEQTTIPQQLANLLYADTAKAGEGWISVNATSGLLVPLNASTFTKSGWTPYDANSGAAPPAGGCGPDGQSMYTTGTGATATVVATCTEFRIYYAKTAAAGVFRYRVDGGAWTAVSGDGSNGLGVVTISGLSAGSHTLDIDTTGNAGTAQIHGFLATNTAGTGIEVLKMGNFGATSLNYAAFAANYIAPVLADLQVDVVDYLLGTNDSRVQGVTPDTMATTASTVLAAVRSANANCGFVTTIPARNGGTILYPVSDFRDVMWRWATDNDCEFYNGHDAFGTYAVENAAGMWLDTLHLNDDGGYRLAKGKFHRLYASERIA